MVKERNLINTQRAQLAAERDHRGKKLWNYYGTRLRKVHSVRTYWHSHLKFERTFEIQPNNVLSCTHIRLTIQLPSSVTQSISHPHTHYRHPHAHHTPNVAKQHSHYLFFMQVAQGMARLQTVLGERAQQAQAVSRALHQDRVWVNQKRRQLGQGTSTTTKQVNASSSSSSSSSA